MATFSTVTSTRSGGTVATKSSAGRVVPSSMRSTRSSVGGTTGNPSVHPRVNIASRSSSRSASSTRRDRSRPPSKRSRSSSTRSGSTLIDPHPGRIDRQLLAEVGDAGDPLPVGTRPADGALHLLAVDDAHQRRHGLDLVVPAEREVAVVHGVDAGREGRIVLGVDRDVAAGDERRQQRGDHPARRALLLDDDDQSVGQHRTASCEVLQDAVVDDVGTLEVQEVPARRRRSRSSTAHRRPSARRPTAPPRRRRNRRRDRAGTGSAGWGSALPRPGSPRAGDRAGRCPPWRGSTRARPAGCPARPAPAERGRCRRRRRSRATTAPTTAR